MKSNQRALRIQLEDGDAVSASLLSPTGADSGALPLLALAHGAGNDMHNPLLSFVCEGVAAAGITTLKFNFPYKERGRKAPDPAPKLEATWRAVLNRLGSDSSMASASVFIGGKSLGGRMASRVVAQGCCVSGLVFLGYPLHPPGKPERQRTAHFDQIRAPSLFVQGTRDSLCDLALLRDALPLLKGEATLHVVEGGDHSFNVLKRLGTPQVEVWNDIVAAVVSWISAARKVRAAD